ncbi:MAG: 4-(cytidine 5'-diphospho)-2-C-methyl-D-erythritol kinase [Nitrospirota bacterium]
MRLRAPAKINWFLTVLRKRDNGYHDIRSLMQCIRLYDDLLFNHENTIEVISDLDIPLEDNLVYRAASLLKRHTSCKKGAKIILRKNIPVGAGLGGGSSDAAYTLLGLNKLWNLGLNNRELSLIGLEIGSDVPFFLNGPSAFVEGRGEKVTPLKINSSIVFLLVKPPVSVSTAWAYESFDKLRIYGEPAEPLTKTTVDIKLFCQVLRKRDFTCLNTMLNNDLERAVVKRYPIVGEIKERLLERGAVISAMSGSGPTVFGVFGSKERALSAAREMGSANWCKVVETLI